MFAWNSSELCFLLTIYYSNSRITGQAGKVYLPFMSACAEKQARTFTVSTGYYKEYVCFVQSVAQETF